MKGRLLIAVLFVTVAVAAPAGAVINGVPDGDGHPNVGLLAFDPDGEGPIPAFANCTGSVLADDAFLTAAHCIEAPFVPPGSQWVVTLEGGGPGDTVVNPGYIPDDLPFAVTVPVVRSIGAIAHPRFNPDTNKNDVAVVLFPEGTFEGIEPVSLPSVRQLNFLGRRGTEGIEATLVGYGADPTFEETPVRLFVPGYRQVGSTPLEGLTGQALFLEVSESGGHCSGDSGGPQFLEVHGSTLVASVGSTGGCRGGLGFSPGVSRGQRLDTPLVQQFLAHFVDLPPAP